MASLNAPLKELSRRPPPEDVLLQILGPPLRQWNVKVQSLLQLGQTFPLVLARKAPSFGSYRGSEQVDVSDVNLSAFCEGVDADQDAAALSDVARDIIMRALRQQTVYGIWGHLVTAEITSTPRRVTDWSTAVGPVQYADLPAGVVRYESSYRLATKRSGAIIFPDIGPI